MKFEVIFVKFVYKCNFVKMLIILTNICSLLSDDIEERENPLKKYSRHSNITVRSSKFTNFVTSNISGDFNIANNIFGHSIPKLLSRELTLERTGEEGSTVKLYCPVQANNGRMNFTWYKNNATKENIIQNKKWKVELKNLKKKDRGDYICVVCNNVGCVNRTIQLKIKEHYFRPYIEKGYPGNKTVLVGSNVNFHCPTVSSGIPSVFWLKLPPFVSKGYFLEDFIEKPPNPHDVQDTFQIFKVKKEDEGWYVCTVFDSFGKSSAFGYLTVNDSLTDNGDKITGNKETNTVLLYTLSTIFSTSFFILTIIVIIVKRFKKETEGGKSEIEMNTHWTKMITGEKVTHSYEEIPMPFVKMEKEKLTPNMAMIVKNKLPVDLDWEVPRCTLFLEKVLGEGEFGKVVKADAVGILEPGIKSIVGVKMLKDDHTETELMALVSEMEIMKIIGKHVNIINLLGCCTQDGPLYVIVEYAANGNLRDFLRTFLSTKSKVPTTGFYLEKQKLTLIDLVSYSFQVAKGMEYLANKKCIHRDLAARNVLVSENYVMKIADFGMAKDVHSSEYYKKITGGKFPVRWMAPEALSEKRFTTLSDVWSFGVLLWEIMTLGRTPYPTVPGRYMYQHLSAGHRMEKPSSCSDEMYSIMKKCWSFKPEERPTFTELVEDFDNMLKELAGQDHLKLESVSSSDTSMVGLSSG